MTRIAVVLLHIVKCHPQPHCFAAWLREDQRKVQIATTIYDSLLPLVYARRRCKIDRFRLGGPVA